jgi:hypothetical protein
MHAQYPKLVMCMALSGLISGNARVAILIKGITDPSLLIGGQRPGLSLQNFAQGIYRYTHGML